MFQDCHLLGARSRPRHRPQDPAPPRRHPLHAVPLRRRLDRPRVRSPGGLPSQRRHARLGLEQRPASSARSRPGRLSAARPFVRPVRRLRQTRLGHRRRQQRNAEELHRPAAQLQQQRRRTRQPRVRSTALRSPGDNVTKLSPSSTAARLNRLSSLSHFSRGSLVFLSKALSHPLNETRVARLGDFSPIRLHVVGSFKK
jgi:hypothetical protein